MRLDYFGLNAAREFPSTQVTTNFILTNLGANARPGRLLRLSSGPPAAIKPALCVRTEPLLRGAAMRRFVYSFDCFAFVEMVHLAFF